MLAFPDLLVDPYLVCLPRDCADAAELDRFVENLLSWSGLLQRRDVAVHFPGTCLEALMTNGFYPYGHGFRQLAARLGAEHLSADFVCRVAQDVLERTPTLAERCAINIVDFEEHSYQVNPDVYITRLADQVGWGFKHDLAVIGCFQHVGSEAGTFLIVSATSTPEEEFADQELHISVRITAIDCSEKMAEAAAVVPFDIHQAIPVAFNSESFLKGVGCLQLWMGAESPAHARDAINTRVEEILTAGTGERARLKRFQVGAQFLESAKRNGFGTRMNVIDSCARILLDVPKNSIEPFRVSADSSKQRFRGDGAGAFRTHLTKDGPGYRLMFWQLKDGSIEFANVGPKHELLIL
jgi:hypothetical protein